MWSGGLGETVLSSRDGYVSADFGKRFQESQHRLDLPVKLVLFLLMVWETLQRPPSTCSPIRALLRKSHQVQSPRETQGQEMGKARLGA